MRWLPRPPDFLVPTQCAVCRDWSSARVCGPCRDRFVPLVSRCRRCALRVPAGVAVCGACLLEPPACDSAVAAVDYGHPWDHLIARFKFQAALDLADVFAQCMEEAWRASGGPMPECLVPVPLSDQRLRERGYNQAWEVARRLARRIGGDADAKLVLRIKDTPHQVSLPIDQRAANVKGAFAIEPTRRDEVRGRRFALIDDVLTTGATADELTRLLRRAGAAEVHVWVLARTPSPTD